VPTTITLASLAQLAEVPGLNLAHGLATLRGKGEKYLELLRKFVTVHADDMTRLAECLADNDSAATVHLAHALKGVAATLGIERVSKLAGQLEAMLRTGTGESSHSAEFDTVVAEIRLELVALSAAVARLPATPAEAVSQ
jgi:HPt (histidine-containing phosphotransfer) domain-containing protein